MNVDTLKEKLADIDADTLRNFILDLYLRYPELSDKIEALTLANDPVALSRVLRKRITLLKRGRRFIDYRASFDFAHELEAVLTDIESGLLERPPEHAFDLVDRFLPPSLRVWHAPRRGQQTLLASYSTRPPSAAGRDNAG